MIRTEKKKTVLLQSGKKQKVAALCATPTYSLMYLHIAVEPCYKPSKGTSKDNLKNFKNLQKR